MDALLAVSPIALALVLLVGLRLPASRAMPLCALAAGVISLLVWRTPPRWVGAAVIEAAVITVSILYIVFGALLLLAVMKRGGAIATLQRTLASLTPDRRLQAVLVAWLLGAFLEGAGGFGTPAAITAPVLMGLGFSPAAAVAAALVGDSTAVTFGAIGTPILIGIGQGVEGVGGLPPGVELLVGRRISLLDLAVGAVMPAVMVGFVVAGSWRTARAALPFALCVGLAHMAAAAAVAHAFGPELPSLLGPAFGLAVALLLLRRRWLVPREPWPGGSPAAPVPDTAPLERPGLVRALLPYGILAALLVVTRVRGLGLGPRLAEVELALRELFGTTVVARLQPVYSPGLYLLLAAGAAVVVLGGRARTELRGALREAGVAALKAAPALVAAVSLVRIFLHSGVNGSGRLAMPEVLASRAADVLGGGWPAVAPWLGALGSFVAGSATFSNMMFAGLQATVAQGAGFDPVHILALQGIGAAAGNMVCVHNVVAACAVTGVLGQEGAILRRTAPALFVYAALASLLGLALA